ncbi:MAG: sulfurtransferase TusA family protein [Proteobacteria bacterium]|nr:sulfurtransferase TusA family protein [Pseudomonadota bacterium]
MTTDHLDLKGLNCPIPVLRANTRIKNLMSGDILVIEVTDPAAPRDFEILCETTGNELLGCETHPEHFTIRVQKKLR